MQNWYANIQNTKNTPINAKHEINQQNNGPTVTHSDSGRGRKRTPRDMTTKFKEQSAQVRLNTSREKTKAMGITQRSSPQPIVVAQGNIEYVERFTYLGSVISSDGDVEADINTRLAKAAAVFRQLDNVWRSSTLSLRIKLDLYTSLIVSTAIYASQTWKSIARICQQLDVFHQRNLRKILGITWKNHVTNMEVLSRTGQQRLQNIVAEIRLRMAGHIIRMPPGWPANHAMSWTPRGSGRLQSRPTKTWRSTFKEDLVDRGVNWNSVRAVATNESRWRTLAAHCPVKDRRF